MDRQLSGISLCNPVTPCETGKSFASETVFGLLLLELRSCKLLRDFLNNSKQIIILCQVCAKQDIEEVSHIDVKKRRVGTLHSFLTSLLLQHRGCERQLFQLNIMIVMNHVILWMMTVIIEQASGESLTEHLIQL